MNTKTTLATLTAICVSISPAFAAFSAKLGPSSRLWLEGNSTLHPYSATATTLDLELTLEPAGAQATLAAGIDARSPARLRLRIPVSGLRSEHSGLDKNLSKALKADKNPDIVFVLKDYEVAKGSGTVVAASGDLTVAGQTKPETISAALSAAGGSVVIDGQQPLLMSDFGVKPPTLMLGALKTDDRVLVKFHLVLEPASNEQKGAKQ